MALYSFKLLDLGSATEQSADRVVARRPEILALSRMGRVVDSVARDGSDGCCYLTAASLAACGQAAAAGVLNATLDHSHI